MFYLLIQNHRNPPLIPEFLVCLEADSPQDAEARAQWLGINLMERNEFHGRRWSWHLPSCGKPRPMIYNGPLMGSGHDSLVLYKNGNMRSTLFSDI